MLHKLFSFSMQFINDEDHIDDIFMEYGRTLRAVLRVEDTDSDELCDWLS